jgi:gamma-glutamylputrescine oxidase
VCGGSSTGRSAGFLTPDSELELSQLVRRFGVEGARTLWEVPVKGIELITDHVRRHAIQCDLIPQDSLFVGKGRAGRRAVQEELAARERLGYRQTSYPADRIPTVLGSRGYSAGVRYPGTYGINALRYAQGVKRVLLERGVRIFESTEARRIEGHTVHAHLGSVTAEQIIVCVDKPSRAFTPFAGNVFHAQTFLSISEPLEERHAQRLFPDAPLQCWDSDLVYTYWRLTGDRRLLVGGGSALTTFALHAVTTPRVIGRVIRRFKKRFPYLRDLEFIQYWPGLIDTTRDLFPTVLRDPQAPWVHYVLGCVGLPWAAFCGDFAARHALGTERERDQRYYRYFAPDRPFLVPLGAERVVGKPLVFSINNAWAKYYQVDRREHAGAARGAP